MISEKKLASCRENAKKATGARTEAGKALVAHNAVKHGVLCETLLPGEDRQEFAVYAHDLKDALSPEGAIELMLSERIVTLSWRLRRVFLAEQGALAREYHSIEAEGARRDKRRVTRTEMDALVAGLNAGDRVIDEEAFILASQIEEDAEAMADTEVARLGIAFKGALEILDRLTRYERTLERSLMTTLKELERLQAARAMRLSADKNVRTALGLALKGWADGFSAKQTEENAKMLVDEKQS